AAAADAPPHCACVYLPHLDYAAQRSGPDSPPALAACSELDAEIASLVDGFLALVEPDELVVVVAGEYRIRPVTHALFPNRILREAGLLGITSTADGELLDIAASRAWALADHQVGHIYLRDGNDRGLVEEIAALFRGRAGVGSVLAGEQLVAAGLAATPGPDATSRCGDLVVMSTLDSWQAYPYWLDDALAPGFARTIDIHRKPGYDPLELHLDRSRLPKIAIPLDTSLVKGSHGALDPANPHETILISSRPGLVSGPLAMHEVAGVILSLFGVA
ncbi:MAG: alkaline phosphatase family protein, partial [Planctomycetia bacterium]